MEINELHAQIRAGSGKGYSRQLRRDGMIPAVLYGPGKETLLLKVLTSELAVLRKKEEKAFIKLIIDDEKGSTTEKLSIIKELQLKPVGRSYVHADFFEITMDQKLTFDISIHFSGKPKGVTDGGELHILKRELKLSCLPAMRPESIACDLSSLEIGDSFKVGDIAPALTEGTTVLDHDEVVIATVSAVKVAVPKAEEAAVEESPVAPAAQ